MAEQIPEAFRDLFQKKAFASLATVMPDGTPQVTPVWVDFDGEHILINSAKGRLKDRNMEARPQVGLDILDPENPYRYLAVRGRVVEITGDGAVDHIRALSQRYTGSAEYPLQPGEERRIYKISTDRVQGNG